MPSNPSLPTPDAQAQAVWSAPRSAKGYVRDYARMRRKLAAQ